MEILTQADLLAKQLLAEQQLIDAGVNVQVDIGSTIEPLFQLIGPEKYAHWLQRWKPDSPLIEILASAAALRRNPNSE